MVPSPRLHHPVVGHCIWHWKQFSFIELDNH
jgi:hypothetical protein